MKTAFQCMALGLSLGLIAACGAQDPTRVRSAPGEGETVRPPLLQAAYRVDALLYPESGAAPQPLTLIRDGARTRMEVTLPERGAATFLVREADTLMVMRLMGGDLVVRVPAESAPRLPDAALQGADLRRLDACTVAGEAGTMYETADTGAGAAGRACIAFDGIMLQAFEGDRLIWQAQRVQRGPQDPTLFEPPPGVSILNAEDIADALTGDAAPRP